MPTDVLACPYCNATAAPPIGARPGQRIPCPRCGESFPYRGDEGAEPAPSPAPMPVPEPEPPAPATPALPRFVEHPAVLFLLGLVAPIPGIVLGLLVFACFVVGFVVVLVHAALVYRDGERIAQAVNDFFGRFGSLLRRLTSPITSRLYSNGQIASFLVGVMGGMALLGIAYALGTEAIRRGYDKFLPKSRAFGSPFYLLLPAAVYVALVAAWFWGWNRRERDQRTAAPSSMRFAGLLGLSVLIFLVIQLGVVMILARTPRAAEPEGPPPVQVVPPAELAALGYLPEDTDVILALHVAELLDDPVGRDLIKHVGNDTINPETIESWSGLKLDEIDHAVLGFPLDDTIELHFTIVVRARRPIDRGRVLKALKAGGEVKNGGRPVYPCSVRMDLEIFHIPPVQIGVNAWFADDSTLVMTKRFADGPRHFIPTTPRTGLEQLRPDLRQLLKERMASPAPVWIAGRLPVENAQFAFLRDVLAGQDDEPLQKLKTFGVWATTTGDGATMQGAFDCTDAEGAKALRAYLDPANRKGLKKLLVTPDAGPMEKAFARSMQFKQDGTWVTFEAKAGADTIRQK
jgi:hypothetical protein